MQRYFVLTMGRVNIIMMSAFSDLIYQFTAISIKIQLRDFVGIERLILKFI